MSEIIKSASKIVFVLLAVSACVGFFIGRLEAKDFMVLLMSAFTFYFANKPTDSSGKITK